MSTITKPMALDESFKTTETTPSNIADVLVGIEGALAQGMGRQANEVSYDNTTSGLSANDVQEAIDEVVVDVNDKVDKVTGKGLSTNDYTTEEKTKLAGIEAGAQVNVQSDWAQTDSSADDFVKNKQLVTEPIEELQNDVQSTQTATGNPLTLTDCAPINAESLVVELEPIQEGSGDPSPTNVRPITGYTECNVESVGKNLFDPAAIDDNKYLDTTTGELISENGYCVSDYIPVYKNQPVYIPQTGSSRRWFYNTSKVATTYLNNSLAQVFTPSENGYIRVSIEKAPHLSGCQIEYGNQASDYEPYASTYATIQFGQTVYGGKVDFLTGVLTVDRAVVDLGDLNWNYNSSYGFLSTTLSSVIKNAPSYSVKANILCSNYETGTYNEITGALSDYKIGVSGGNYGYVVTRDTRYSDATTFKTAMSGVQLVYELATPQTIQLTPQELKLLKQYNHITTNGTTITLGYQPDNVIGEVKGEIENATPISGTVTATLLHEEDQGEDWIVGFTGEINGHFDTEHFDYYLTARYSHAYNTNTQILNMDNCIDGDYVQIWQTGTLDFSVDGGVTVTISVTATKLTFTVNCIGDSIFGIYSSSETTGQVKYLITPARKG